jgi:hypothetical protein
VPQWFFPAVSASRSHFWAAASNGSREKANRRRRLVLTLISPIIMTGLESGNQISPLWNRSFNLFEEVEKIDLAEDLFGTDLPIDLALDNPSELVDYLVPHLRGWGPNAFAADFLKKLAKTHNTPALAQGLHDSWRREQISAIIQGIFNTGDRSAGGDDEAVIPVRKPRSPKSGGRSAAQNLDEDHPSAHR